MSYTIVKYISINEKENIVKVCSAESNIRPIHYFSTSNSYLSKILQEKGKERVEIEIMKRFFEGSYQGNNYLDRYSRALQIGKYMFPKTYNFYASWDNQTGELFEKFLQLLLHIESFKNYYIVTATDKNGKRYIKRNRYSYNIVGDFNKASKLSSREEAEYIKSLFTKSTFSRYTFNITEYIGGLK